MNKVKIFLSWSGDISRQAASLWRDWLPIVLNACDPWMSEDDVDKGAQWLSEISNHLKDSFIAILFLTPENVHSDWLHFEAGAVAKNKSATLVCTYLMGITKSELAHPLSMFQATSPTKDDTFKLISAINKNLGSMKLSESQCRTSFESRWNDLSHKLHKLEDKTKVLKVQNQIRPEREMIREILEMMRAARINADPACKKIRDLHERHGNYEYDLLRLFAVSMDLGWPIKHPNVFDDLVKMLHCLKRGETESAFSISANLRALRRREDYLMPEPITGYPLMNDPDLIP